MVTTTKMKTTGTDHPGRVWSSLTGDIPDLSGPNPVLWDGSAGAGRLDQRSHCGPSQPDPSCDICITFVTLNSSFLSQG